jgi:hydroxymethylpyrimidine pyrophosphatase-like HAD family hydrolase/CheY-like chemotaxis protein
MTDSHSASKIHTAHVLIVEDSLGVARALNRTLSLPQGGGHRVEICDSGEAALHRLRSAHFDLLITDLRLPGMNGLAVLDHARQISPETRSILITAFGSPQVEERARHLANAYLPKPFRLHDLIQLVQRILGEPVARRQPFLVSDAQRRSDVPRRAANVAMAKRKAAYLKVFACDLDGTLAEQGQITPATWEVLRQARRDTASPIIILVTSHTLDAYPTAAFETTDVVALCQAIVAENGAVVYFPQRDDVALPFGRLSPAVTRRLADLNVVLKHGKASAVTSRHHDETILEVLRDVGDGMTIECDMNAAVLLPPDANKGAGLHYALRELGYSPRNVVACGDTENDHSVFEIAELAVATSNAPADVQALADAVLLQPGETGVQTLIATLLAGRVPDHIPRLSRRLTLGHRTSETPVHLAPFSLVNGNLGIFGTGDEQQSRLAGSLAEKLSRHGYQMCIVDPLGDHQALDHGPDSQYLGGPETPLLPAADVAASCERDQANLILDLSTCTVEERAAYVRELLPAMQNLRARFGRPHWFLVGSVHALCASGGKRLTDLFLDSLRGGGFALLSGRPSQIPPSVLETLDCWLVTRLDGPEEVDALRPFLSRHAGGPAALSQLPSLPASQAYLYLGDVEQPSLSTRGFIKLRLGI